MIVNVTASICFLIVLLILIFDFFSKKTLSNLDNNSFKHLSVVCAFGLLIEFLTYLLVIFKFEIHSLPMMVLARFIFIYYLIFMYYFIIYVFCVCKKIQSRNEQYDRFKK